MMTTMIINDVDMMVDECNYDDDVLMVNHYRNE